MEEREMLAVSTAVDTESSQEPGAAMTDVADIADVKEVTTTGRVDRLAMSRQRTYTAEITKAHVALLERGVILSKQVDLFRLVNRHYYTLQNWHDQNTGWRIQRGATAIRLVRQLSAITPGYVYDRLREPRDFACLTWILWYAENRQLTGRGNEQQFLLSQFAEQIQEQSLSDVDNETGFDFRRPADRYSIQRALQYLEDLGGVQLVVWTNEGMAGAGSRCRCPLRVYRCDTFARIGIQPAIIGGGGRAPQQRGKDASTYPATTYTGGSFSCYGYQAACASLARAAARPNLAQV